MKTAKRKRWNVSSSQWEVEFDRFDIEILHNLNIPLNEIKNHPIFEECKDREIIDFWYCKDKEVYIFNNIPIDTGSSFITGRTIKHLALGDVVEDRFIKVEIVTGMHKRSGKLKEKRSSKMITLDGLKLMYPRFDCINYCFTGERATEAVVGKCKLHKIEELVKW